MCEEHQLSLRGWIAKVENPRLFCTFLGILQGSGSTLDVVVYILDIVHNRFQDFFVLKFFLKLLVQLLAYLRLLNNVGRPL